MSPDPLFLRVVGQSGLTKVELARIYGVTRQTIWHWITVAPPRAGTIGARMAEVITKALLHSINLGALPLRQMTKELRESRIAKIIGYMQSMKPAPPKG